jgi:Cell wall-active antibiotics response 4TMS YvqF
MSVPLPPGSVPAGPVNPYPSGPVLVPPELVPDRQGAMACMSNTTRNGSWTLPRLFRALAIMGEVKLDLRHIHLGAGTSEIQVRAFMGNIEILVPHNLRVECEGTPFMGEFSVKRRSKSMPSPEAPLIRITGGAFMASVKVRIIDPQAPSALDKVRAWVNGT